MGYVVKRKGLFMSYGKGSLQGYLLKAGVGDSYAYLVAEHYGDFYTEAHTKCRMAGHGGKSKAMAVLSLLDHLMAMFEPGPAGTVWDLVKYDQIETEKDVLNSLMLTTAEFYAYAATMAYGLGKDSSELLSRQYRGYINGLLNASEEKGITVSENLQRDSLQELAESFGPELQRITIGSLALGSRKGLFSSLFG
jgi:hypothetical protein